METVESGMALRDTGFVQPVSRLVPAVFDSGSYRIGLITLDVKGAGARSAGNPLATCDVAGVGNGIFTEDLRASARPYRRGLPGDPVYEALVPVLQGQSGLIGSVREQIHFGLRAIEHVFSLQDTVNVAEVLG